MTGRGYRDRRSQLKRWSGISLLLGLLAGPVAFGQSASEGGGSYRFDIPAQPLMLALRDFTAVTGRQVVVPSGDVSRYTSNAVSGTFTSEEALTRISQNTGLVVEPISGQSFRLAASAQVAPSSTARSRGLPTVLDEIVVTATKREESLQNVPISVTAFDSAFITSIEAVDFYDFASSVPNVSASQQRGTGGARYFIRGVGQYDRLSATTGIYLDETPMQLPSTINAGTPTPLLFDMDRVEVLRGPQSTLFGASTMGGTIRMISNAPDTSEFSAAFDGSTSWTKDGGENYETNGMVNAPLIQDRLALRLTATQAHIAGWIDDVRPTTVNTRENLEPGGDPNQIIEDVNTVDLTSVRGQLLFDIDDRSSLLGLIHYQTGEDGTSGHISGDVVGAENSRRYARYQDSSSEDEFLVASLTYKRSMDWFGGSELVANASYLDRDLVILEDFTHFYQQFGLPLVNNRPSLFLNDERQMVEQFSQEIRLATNSDGPFQFLAGLFYRDLEEVLDNVRFINQDNGADVETPISDNLTVFDEQEFGVFGEAAYSLTDELTVTVGARYFDYDNEEVLTRGIAFFSPAGGLVSGDASEDGFNTKAALDYRIGENVMAYASYSEGFRTGGFNDVESSEIRCPTSTREALGLPATPSQYDSDRTRNYELGFKSELLDNRLRFNAAVFHIDWVDYQQLTAFACGEDPATSPLIAFAGNAGEVRLRGFEAEVTSTPMDGLLLMAGVGYTDARLQEDTLNQPAGDRLPDIPLWQGYVSSQYQFPINDRFTASLFGRFSYTDERTSALSGFFPPPSSPSFENVDLRLSLIADNWEVAIFGRNLTDDDQPSFVTFADDGPERYVVQPRTVGVNLIVNTP